MQKSNIMLFLDSLYTSSAVVPTANMVII